MQHHLQQQQHHHHHQQQVQHHEQLERALEAKREQLRQLDETTRRMRQQLATRQTQDERRHETQSVGARLGDTGLGSGESKLDAILAQTLQMQAMFMAHMAGVGVGQGGAGGSMQGGNERALAHHPGPLGVEQSHPTGQSPGDNLPPLAGVPAHQIAPGAGGYAAPEQDVHLLNQLQGMAEKLNRADVEAHEAAEAALEKARAQVWWCVLLWPSRLRGRTLSL